MGPAAVAPINREFKNVEIGGGRKNWNLEPEIESH
jgi:hypothetical protein